MKRCSGWLVLVWTLLGSPGIASAALGDWATDPGVGVNQISYQIDIECPAPTFACSLIDGYTDTQISDLSGAGELLIDESGASIRFETDGMADFGAGLQATYSSLDGSDLTFGLIPFAGVPELTNVLVASLSNPWLVAPGLDLTTPGDFPFTGAVSMATRADMVGDLQFLLPEISFAPGDVTLSGVVRVLGDTDHDGETEYELRDLVATSGTTFPATIGGEPVLVDVTASLTANLSGTAPAPDPIPLVGSHGLVLMGAALLLGGAHRLRSAR